MRKVVAQVTHEMRFILPHKVKLEKVDQATIDKILNSIRLDGFDVLTSDDQDFMDILQAVMSDGQAVAFDQLGIDDVGTTSALGTEPGLTNQLNDEAVAYAQDRAAELVGKKWEGDILVDNPNAQWAIDSTTRELLRSDITASITNGWTTDELAKVLSNNYAFSDARAATISRTEIAFADVAGNMSAYKASGVVSGKYWSPDAGACDICMGNADDGVISLDGVFSSGDDAPPAHPNCECDVIPVTSDNNDEG